MLYPRPTAACVISCLRAPPSLSSGLEHSAGVLKITEDGTCYRSVRVMDAIHNKFDVRYFPFDTHRLKLKLGCYAMDDSSIAMKWHRGGVGTETNALTTKNIPSTSTWKMAKPDFYIDEPFISSTGHQVYTNLAVDFTVERENYMWTYGYIVPSAIVVIIALCGLLLEPTTEMRCGMHVIAVLVQVTLLSQLMDKMPAVGSVSSLNPHLRVTYIFDARMADYIRTHP